MTVVVGTAGHIDHGKTSLLRALTGIDADRLPEEQRRGLTIDVGYAHLELDDGTSIDFVDVPGHDALIGNMLVGAGEIDAALLVVAADDGQRAQTLEHLELLDALGIRIGLAVITKADLTGPDRAAEVAADVSALLARTSLSSASVIVASSATGQGMDGVLAALLRVRDHIAAQASAGPAGPRRLAIDRSFAVKGRGAVVTGSLRGGGISAGDVLRLEPGELEVRVRGLQVHHDAVAVAPVGRTALNLAGATLDQLPRGAVLTAGPGVEVTDRMLVTLSRPAELGGRSRAGRPGWPPADGARLRLHVGTAQVEATVGRHAREATALPDGRSTAVLRLGAPIATFSGDRGVLRRPSPGDVVAGVVVLDPRPAVGVARRRVTGERLATLAAAVAEGDADAGADALVALHGAISPARIAAVVASLARPGAEIAEPARGLVLAPDVGEALEAAALDSVAAFHRESPLATGIPAAALRPSLRTALRRLVTVQREDADAADQAIAAAIDDLVARGRLGRSGDRLLDPARGSGPAEALAASMDRLEALLDVAAPPDLSAAARLAGCPADGVRALESAGRIVRVEADLAWAAAAFQSLAGQALALAHRSPLTPAALRDAIGTSRRYVMPLLEDLDRRGILSRTPAGHVPGPRALRAAVAPRVPQPPVETR